MKSLRLVGVAFLLAATNGLLLSESELASCSQQVNTICPNPLYLESSDILMDHVAAKLTCLIQNQPMLSSDACFFHAVEDVLTVIDKKKTPCKDEFNKQCGKVYAKLKKAIENTSITGTLEAAVELVECLVQHAESLWKKCVNSSNKVECAQLCAPMQNRILGLGYSLACIGEHAEELGSECVLQETESILEAVDVESGGSCKDQLRHDCGKEIDELKKEMGKTSVLGVLRASLEVVECIAQHAEDLWEHCAKFEEEEGGSKTKQPTKKPTKKHAFEEEELFMIPSALEEEVGGSKTKQPTKKPTKKHAFEVEEEELMVEEDVSGSKTKQPTKKPTKKHAFEEEELFMIASAFEEEMGGTKKPTKKPTKKHAFEEEELFMIPSALEEGGSKTKQPTKKPTKKHAFEELMVEEGSKTKQPTTASPTSKPTKKHVMEEIALVSVSVNLDACVDIAQRMCQSDIARFNESPFDEKLLNRVEACVDAHLEEIELACMQQQQQQQQVFHEPCQHVDEVGILPLCGEEHRCRGGARTHHALSAVLLAIALALTVRLVKRRYQQGVVVAIPPPADYEADGVARPLLTKEEEVAKM